MALFRLLSRLLILAAIPGRALFPRHFISPSSERGEITTVRRGGMLRAGGDGVRCSGFSFSGHWGAIRRASLSGRGAWRCSDLFGLVQVCSGLFGDDAPARRARARREGLTAEVDDGVDSGKCCQLLSTWRQPLSTFGCGWQGGGRRVGGVAGKESWGARPFWYGATVSRWGCGVGCADS